MLHIKIIIKKDVFYFRDKFGRGITYNECDVTISLMGHEQDEQKQRN